MKAAYGSINLKSLWCSVMSSYQTATGRDPEKNLPADPVTEKSQLCVNDQETFYLLVKRGKAAHHVGAEVIYL